MKHQDPLDESRGRWVDGQIDAANQDGVVKFPLTRVTRTETLTDSGIKRIDSVEILDKSIPEEKRKEWEAIIKRNLEKQMEEKGRRIKERIIGQLDNDKPQEWPFENGWWGPTDLTK